MKNAVVTAFFLWRMPKEMGLINTDKAPAEEIIFICLIHIGISNKMKDGLYKKSITR